MFKQSLTALSLLVATNTFAQTNTPFIGVEIGRITSNFSGDSAKANTKGAFVGYRYYVTNNTSVEGSLHYSQYDTDTGIEKFYMPQVGIGYDFKPTDGIIIRPKVKFGREFIKETGENLKFEVNAKSLALEVAFKNNFSVEYSYRKVKNSDVDNYSNNISLIYNF